MHIFKKAERVTLLSPYTLAEALRNGRVHQFVCSFDSRIGREIAEPAAEWMVTRVSQMFLLCEKLPSRDIYATLVFIGYRDSGIHIPCSYNRNNL